MTNLFLFIMPLVGGYWFLVFWNLTKFKIKNKTGYRIFLESALVGIALLFISKFLISIISFFTSVEFISKWFIPTSFNLESTLAIAIGIALPFIFNCFSDEHKFKGYAAEEQGSLLYVRIREAIEKKRLIELTMQNGKVYIGYVTIAGDLDNECVNLIPYANGYRDEKTKTLVIENDYLETVALLEGVDFFPKFGVNPSELSVTLKLGDVATARTFYPKIYAEYKRLTGK